MFIPRKKIAQWAVETIQACHADLDERIQQGALYRNLYLTGDENGTPTTYPKTYAYIDNLASFLFSPVELAFKMRLKGGGNPTEREMCRVASSELGAMLADAGVYADISSATEWSLPKGKTFIKLGWERGEFTSNMIQPEFMGVLLPDKKNLKEQPAFVHSTYYTPSQFAATFRALSDIKDIMEKVGKRVQLGTDEQPVRSNALKQIVLGGMNPFQQSGSSSGTGTKGVVNFLGGPQPTFDPKIMLQLIRLDELWAWDSANDDWATFQMVGNVVITGDKAIRNAFADMYDPANPMQKLPEKFRENNPLTGLHPFIEVSPNALDGYFWGRSELCNVGVLQMQMNARMNGINRLLRRQEKPPHFFSGTTGITRDRLSAMDMPGGFYNDPSPQAKMQDLYPKMPEGMWETLHEMEAIFDEMSGLPPTMKGRGEVGVRSGDQVNALTRNASPRFKDRALSVERSVAELGDLALAMLRVYDDSTQVAWLDPSSKNLVADLPPDNPTLEPPATGMKQFPFRWSHIPMTAKVVVDSHSSSPAFMFEARQLMFDLAKIGAASPEEVVEHTNPPGADDMVADMRRKAIEQSELIKAHPELLPVLLGGHGKKKR